MGAVPLRGCKGCIRVFYLSNGGATVISKVEHELNEEIRDKEIRLISESGEQLGIMSSQEALRLAELYGCTTAVLKERSPSCGSGAIYDGTFTGTVTEGWGTAAALLRRHGVRVLGESQLASLLEELGSTQ